VIQAFLLSLFLKNPENQMVFGARTQEPKLGEAVPQPALSRQSFTQDRLTFFHPDYTVGSGISPDHAPGDICLSALAGFTAGRDSGRCNLHITLPRRSLFNLVALSSLNISQNRFLQIANNIKMMH
jgi:hypothetical protein